MKAKRWTRSSETRLAFLMGLGWNASQIAADPIVRTTESAVRSKADRLELRFRDAPTALITSDIMAVFDHEAKRYALTGRQLAGEAFKILAADTGLLHNVIDKEG